MTNQREAASRSEWRQFQLLSRDSIRHLINAMVIARGMDPMQFAIWIVAVIATPPAMYAFSRIFLYTSLRSATISRVESALFTDRMFFVLYAMLAAALLAALAWEALFPDHVDQQALGALPVRPRTVAAARLAAALGMALVFAAAIAVPTAILFAMVATTSPVMGFLPTIVVSHLIATIGGAMFVFIALLVARAVVALVFGVSAADRLALLLQFVTVLALVEVFFYLPVLLPFLVRQMLATESSWRVLPPVWFAAQYTSMVGTRHLITAEHARPAFAALLAAVAVAVPMYTVPARIMARRALESQTRHRTNYLSAIARTATRVLRLTPPVGSVFEFTVASLTRSHRHLLVVATYLGVGIAVGVIALLAASVRGTLVAPSPQTASLSLPLVITFFAIFGLRAAFNIPTELAANWSFRLSAPDVAKMTAAARAAIIVLAVVPAATAAMALAAAARWNWTQVLAVGAFTLLAGHLLAECALYGWPKIPFACAHAPGTATVKTRWLLAVLALNVFAFRGAELQLLALRSLSGTALYVGGMLAAITMMRAMNRREAQRRTIDFDGPGDTESVTLNLSEALQ